MPILRRVFLVIAVSVFLIPASVGAESTGSDDVSAMSAAEAADEIETSLPAGLFPAGMIIGIDAGEIEALAERLGDAAASIEELPLEDWYDDEQEAKIAAGRLMYVFSTFAAAGKYLDLEGVDDLYFAVTTRGGTPFFDVVELVETTPFEAFPESLHFRLVITADGDERDAIRDELERRLDDLIPEVRFFVSDEEIAYDIDTTDGAVTVDFAAPMMYGVDANEALSEILEKTPQPPEPTAAMVDFAGSDAPISLYADHRDVARLKALGAIYPQLPIFGHVDGEAVSVGGLDMAHDEWTKKSSLAHRMLNILGGANAEFVDTSLRIEDVDEFASARAVSTRTPYGARLAESLGSRDLALPGHPDHPVYDVEFGGDVIAADGYLRRPLAHLAGLSSVGDASPEETVESMFGSRLLMQPAGAWVPRALSDELPATPLAGRMTFHAASDVVEDGGDDLVIVASALFENTPANRLELEEFFDDRGTLYARASVFQTRGDARIEKWNDHLLVRYVFGESVDEVFDDDPVADRVARFRYDFDFEGADNLDYSRLRRRRAGQMREVLDAYRQLPEGITSLEVTPRESLSIVTAGEGGNNKEIVDVESSAWEGEEPCVAELKSLLAEYRGADRSGESHFDEADRLEEIARGCAGETGRTELTEAAAHTLWYAGLEEEHAYRYDDARRFYDRACELDESAACDASRRLEPLVDAELPVALTGLTIPGSQTQVSVADVGTVAQVNGEAIEIGDVTVGVGNRLGTDELSGALEARRLITPNSLFDRAPLVRQLADEFGLRNRLMHQLGIVAAPGADARAILGAFGEIDDISLHALMASPEDDHRVPTATMRPRLTDDWRDVASDSILVVGADGIDLIIGGEAVDPVEGCPEGGPTICTVADSSSFWDDLDAGFVEIRDRGQRLFDGRTPLSVVVDTEVDWEMLTRLVRLASHSRHPQWTQPEGTVPRSMRWVYDEVVVIVEE